VLVLLCAAGPALAEPPADLPPPWPLPPAEAPPAQPGSAMPPWLPRYDLDVRLDVAGHTAVVRQRVTWFNRHQRPAEELVFNAHSHYTVPKDQVGLIAKTLEIMRLMPGESLYGEVPLLDITRVTLGGSELAFHYREDNNTALVVPLPRPVGQGESVTVDLEFTFHLPEKQGRWSYWKGVTTLSNWLPVLAVYDDQHGWQPTPFIPWHQPFFNEAGVYTARVTLPADQHVATSGSVVAVHDLYGGLKQVDILAPGVRDFAFLCSARYCEYAAQVGGVRVRCMAFPEHEHYAREIVKIVCEVLPVYQQWFGPYPWPELTFSESYFGWNGNECATLVMIDERVFQMPHFAGGYVEYLIAHETCHQWWYNLLGTNGYCETWMDEAFANYFAHRFLNQKYGRNNDLMNYPGYLEWLPNIKRENYRFYGLYGTLGRGEATPVCQEMEKFGHVITLFSMCYDKGGKILGMIEDRLGEAAFIDFLHIIYQRYQYRIIRVADFKCELETYTGRSWEEFFHTWLYTTALPDWSVEKVDLEPLGDGPKHGLWARTFLDGLHAGEQAKRPHKVTVLLHQKGDYNEQTVLGFRLDDSDGYQVRIPIQPQIPRLELDDPPARVEVLPDNRVRVEVLLPCRPTQIAVDPDQVLVDPDPSNNFWKPPVRCRFAPLYTFLEETTLTCDYDRWNFIYGPWIAGSIYKDPWYTRQTMIGGRAGLYRTEYFTGGAYAAYRTDFRDVVIGADGLWDHTPWHNTQIGFNVEHRIAQIEEEQPNVNRAVLFGRYVFQYGDSLYLPPMHYLEVFTDYQDNPLPFERHAVAGAVRFDSTANAGIHYSLNYLTPYWDPQGGFQLDAAYAGGVVDAAGHEGLHLLEGQLAFVKCTPDLDGWLPEQPGLSWLGPALRWLSDTRWAFRAFGAAGLPNKGEYFALGGSDRFRGFDLEERQGSVVWVGSVEWRVPVLQQIEWDFCDHVGGIRNIYAAAFYDVGDAYVHGHSYGPVAHALGLGLRLDTAWLGVVERATVRLDVAKAVNADTGVQVWFGVGHPF
jgi:hypothetical protein